LKSAKSFNKLYLRKRFPKNINEGEASNNLEEREKNSNKEDGLTVDFNKHQVEGKEDFNKCTNERRELRGFLQSYKEQKEF
jgi:hypothetical protein